MMIKVGVFGASGRVGKLLLENLKETSDMSVSSVYVRNELDFPIDPSILITTDMKSRGYDYTKTFSYRHNRFKYSST